MLVLLFLNSDHYNKFLPNIEKLGITLFVLENGLFLQNCFKDSVVPSLGNYVELRSFMRFHFTNKNEEVKMKEF